MVLPRPHLRRAHGTSPWFPRSAAGVGMSYHQFRHLETAEEFGSFLIEYIAADPYLDPGFYWQACFPGCLPDGDPVGPFTSYAAALEDARQ